MDSFPQAEQVAFPLFPSFSPAVNIGILSLIISIINRFFSKQMSEHSFLGGAFRTTCFTLQVSFMIPLTVYNFMFVRLSDTELLSCIETKTWIKVVTRHHPAARYLCK